MRILAIRGANLASLKDPFEVDLTAEPLASAGLFAITGTTGAGKSTILDAMCLALYGESPRQASGGINDEVPDSTGDTIRSRDARAILRRGAASGYAEVDFVAADGAAYRAHWGARRARGRSDGRLQNVERALTRLSDAQVLDSQITAVNARVAELAGLSFDEFRRTVLLAQGDFDAFLVAGTGERAALLEKVTGTRVYRDISRRVYERHGAAEQALAALQARREGAMAMTDAARAEVLAAIDALSATLQTLESAIAARSEEIAAHVGIAAARTQAADAAAAETAAHAALAAAAPERAQLDRLDRAQGLRAEHEAVGRTRSAVAGLEQALRETEERQAQIEAQARDAAEADAQAATVLAEAERLFKAFGPDWTRATDQDGQIRTAAQECARGETALDAARGKVAVQRKTLEQLLADQQAQEEARAAAETALATRPGAKRLAETWDSVAERIDERITLTGERTAQDEAAGRAAEQAAYAEAGLAALDPQDASDRAAITALGAEAARADARLAEIGRDDPGAALARAIAAASALREMIAAAKDCDAAEADRERAGADRAAAEADRVAATAAAAAADTEAARAAAAATALTAPQERAEAAASAQAAELRRHLADGTPCPVCGATEHPALADTALAALAAQLRSELETERRAEADATRKATEARRANEAARLRAEAAATARSDADRRQKAAQATFADARKASGLTDLPNTACGAKSTLAARLTEIEAQQATLADLQTEERALRQGSARAAATIARHRTALDARVETRAALTRTLTEAQGAGQLAQQAAAQARTRQATLDRQLAPMLAAVECPPDALDLDPAATRKTLEDRVAWYRDHLAARAAAETALAALRPQISAADAALAAATEAREAEARALDGRRRMLDRLRGERAELLGGEDTETHRTRHNAARVDAQAKRDATAKALADLRNSVAGLAARCAGLTDDLDAARAAAQAAARALKAGCTAAGLTVHTLDALLAEGRDAADALRQRLKGLEDAVTGARSAAAARKADLDRLIAAGVPKTPLETLRTAQAAAEEDRATLHQTLGGHRRQIEADDDLRRALGTLDAEIATAAAERDTWAAVNAAVGSAQGDKFARIAQGVTLALLVERANRHLADLKPRYRLAPAGPDLALHIIDRDMGDETRSTRSLSGGERFLVSLALALALSRMGSHGGLAATLFIDEGFGALDAESLDVAIDALEALQAQGRTIGVISHVDAMKDRIPVQVRVVRRGAGASEVELTGFG